MPRAAPLKPLVDLTPLDGPVVDVGVRVGWLLRMARLLDLREPRLGLEHVARLLDLPTTALHRRETGVIRDGVLIERYERLFDLPVASLRAPVDILCRTFPYAPRDVDPGPAVLSVESMSALTDAVCAREPTGGEWLRWARALAQPGNVALPHDTGFALVDQLVGELNDSVGHGYPARYEALALLRCSHYGPLVLAVATARIAHPDVSVLRDMMSMVGEDVTHDALTWCLDLLADPRGHVVAGAVLALENMSAVGGDRVWSGHVARIIAAYNAATPDSEHWVWLSHLVRLLPASANPAERVRRPLAPTPAIPTWTQNRASEHWTRCDAAAYRVTQRLGIPEQPLLTRLVFEIAIGPHETRAVTGYMLLGALDRLITTVAPELDAIASTHPDPAIRSRATRRLAGMRRDAPSRT